MDASSDRYTSSLTNSMSGKSHQITQTTLDRIQPHNKTCGYLHDRASVHGMGQNKESLSFVSEEV